LGWLALYDIAIISYIDYLTLSVYYDISITQFIDGAAIISSATLEA
jgi:hypothetical protein